MLLGTSRMQSCVVIALKIKPGVPGMMLQACKVAVVAMVAGEACQPSPKSPWSGGEVKVFYVESHRICTMHMYLEFFLTGQKSGQ